MKRLLSVNNYHYNRGGAENVFLSHNNYFEKFGWTVASFSMKHPKNIESIWSDYFINEIEFGRNYTFIENAINALNIIYSFESISKFKSIAKAFKPDICHIHNIYHHISPSFLHYAKKSEIPIVLTLHDLKLICPSYKMYNTKGICEKCKCGAIWNVFFNRCIKQSYPLSFIIFIESIIHRLFNLYNRYIDVYISPSKFYLKKFREWGFPPNKLTYIPNFIDCSFFKPKGKPGNYFIYFGRLAPEKGISTFINAVYKSNTKALIVGDGPEKSRLKFEADRINANVDFIKHVDKATLIHLIQNSRAVVLPSEWYENSPLSILEAYALERPVIGSNIGGIPELIKDGETGSLFTTNNIDELSNHLSDYEKKTDSTILEIGKSGRKFVEDKFSILKYTLKINKIYKKLCTY